jgi:hypothetical protein
MTMTFLFTVLLLSLFWIDVSGVTDTKTTTIAIYTYGRPLLYHVVYKSDRVVSWYVYLRHEVA